MQEVGVDAEIRAEVCEKEESSTFTMQLFLFARIHEDVVPHLKSLLQK
jgi:hypothetical protein